jgi:hypothetical protein
MIRDIPSLWPSLAYCLPFFGIRRSFWITSTQTARTFAIVILVLLKGRWQSVFLQTLSSVHTTAASIFSPVLECCCYSLQVFAWLTATLLLPTERDTRPRWLLLKILLFAVRNYFNCRSRWPRNLRCRCEPALLLGLRVRIPYEAWIFVSFACCVLYR